MFRKRKGKLFLRLIYLTIFLLINVQVVQAISNHWSKGYVDQLIKKKVIEYADEEKLNELVTEEELYNVINKILDKKDSKIVGDELITREKASIIIASEFELVDEKEVEYNDIKEISDFAKSSINKLNYVGALDGYPDGEFKPHNYLKRGEMYKLLGKINIGNSLKVADNLKNDKKAKSKVGTLDLNYDLFRVVSENDINENFNTEQSINTTEIYNEPTNIKVDLTTEIDVSAEMGSVFRSIDIDITVRDDSSAPEVYYLAKVTGSNSPDADTIMKYGNNELVEGLLDGTVVRGKWFCNTNVETNSLTLTGMEGVDRYKDELGFIDGYNYDLYFVALNSKGETSEVKQINRVMAMPFDAKTSDNRTYTIRNISKEKIEEKYKDLKATHIMNEQDVDRTARQFENIQRMADIYKETEGVHGNIAFLTSSAYTYVLGSDIDLSEYGTANNGTGFSPIGNVQKDSEYIFRGSLYGNDYTIKNLYIKRDRLYQGLFGKVENANISHLTLENPIVFVLGNNSNEYAFNGSLVAFAKDSNIEKININNGTIKTYSNKGQLSATGGVAGYAENTNLSNINVKDINIATYDPKNKDLNTGVTGGIIAVYNNVKNSNKLLNKIEISGEISSHGEYAGGVVGIASNSSEGRSIYADSIISKVNIESTSDVCGGVVSYVLSENQNDGVITFSNCDFVGSVRGGKTVGGMVGVTEGITNKNIVFKNCTVTGRVHSYGTGYSVGGFGGSIKGGSFENSISTGEEIKVASNNTGGFIGQITGNTNIILCGTNKNVSANGNVGGFVGLVINKNVFDDCYASGNVNSVSKTVGGFAGAIDKDNVELNKCTHFGMVNRAY